MTYSRYIVLFFEGAPRKFKVSASDSQQAVRKALHHRDPSKGFLTMSVLDLSSYLSGGDDWAIEAVILDEDYTTLS